MAFMRVRSEGLLSIRGDINPYGILPARRREAYLSLHRGRPIWYSYRDEEERPIYIEGGSYGIRAG